MKPIWSRLGSAASAVILATLLLLLWLTVMEPFPILRYAPREATRSLISSSPFEGIASGVSVFLWEKRALDITAQAFVIVAAIVCCLALLKPEEGEGP
jgi:hypothetical protein